MIDGVHFGDHLCVVALGIGIDGTKHPLGLAEGSTENTSVVTDLLTGLRDRGLDMTRPVFVGIDGGKALHAAVVRGVRASGDRSLPAPLCRPPDYADVDRGSLAGQRFRCWRGRHNQSASRKARRLSGGW